MGILPCMTGITHKDLYRQALYGVKNALLSTNVLIMLSCRG